MIMKKTIKNLIRWILLIVGAFILVVLTIAPLCRDLALLTSHINQIFISQNADSSHTNTSWLQNKLEGSARSIDKSITAILEKIAYKSAGLPESLQKDLINSDSIESMDSHTLESNTESAHIAKDSNSDSSLTQKLDMAQDRAQTLSRNYSIISQATYDTMYMVIAAIIFAVVFGLPLGVFLSITKMGGILSMPSLNATLGFIVNVVRSFPFIILIVLLLPLSKVLVGSMIGASAAIVPLGIAAIPFIARLFEGVFEELDKGLIEASLSMGASKIEVVKMMIAESMPGLVNAIVITIIGLIGYSAMAGALGAGGLGDVAIRLGFQGYEEDILFSSVIVIIVLVQWIQSVGDKIVLQLRKNR